MEIKELQKLDESLEYNYISELEYVTLIGQEIAPFVDESGIGETISPSTFANRYFGKFIDISFKDEFLNNKEIQDTLEAFSIDVTKFWYLLLFVKDYIEVSLVDAIAFNPSIREELSDIITGINGIVNSGEITFRADKKHKKVINDIRVLRAIRNAFIGYLNNPSDNIDIKIGIKERDKSMELMYRLGKFNDIMMIFLEDKKGVIDKTKPTLSLDKSLLISRLIYVTKISTNEKYTYDADALKNNLRRYDKDKINTTSFIY